MFVEIVGFILFISGLSMIYQALPSFLHRFIEGRLYKDQVDNNDRSRHISQSVKDKVWRRDQGKCVECGSSDRLEFDHIIPFAKGGSNTYRNIQLLCEKCNRTKSDKIG